MQDSKSASLILVAGSAGLAYWWWHLTTGRLAPAAAVPAPTDRTGGPALGPGPSLPPALEGDPLARLKQFAAAWGLPITSALRPGDTGSLHSKGLAIDVGVPPAALQQRIKEAAAMQGIHVLPEEYTGTRNGARSTGPHWHLSWPQMRHGRLVW